MTEDFRASHERLSLLLQSVFDGIWECDLLAGTVSWNETYDQLFGPRPTDTAISWQWWIDRIHPDDRQRVHDSLKAVAESGPEHGNSWRQEYRFRRRNGSYAVVVDRAVVARDESGRVTRIVGAMLDITERKRAEENLRESEERLRAIVDTAVDAIITIDQRGIVTSVNPATERMFGYPRDELIGQNVSIFMPPPYDGENEDYIARYLQTGEARLIGRRREVWGRRKDGSTFPVDLSVSEVKRRKGRLFIGIIRDLSEIKALQEQLLHVAEDQQRVIGQELHDGVGQELVAMRWSAESLLDSLKSRDAPEAETAQRLLTGLAEALGTLRTAVRGLVPMDVSERGLAVALKELVDRTRDSSGLGFVFECKESAAVDDERVAVQLYRIAQEAIANAVRHSRGTRVRVSLEGEKGSVALRVADDGVGIPASAASEPGLGIRIMRYRASVIGGQLTVERRKPHGTMVRCIVREKLADADNQKKARARQGASRR